MTKTNRLLLIALLAVSYALTACSAEENPGKNPDGADVEKVCARIQSLSGDRPREALSLVDSALDAGMISPLKARIYQAKVYFNPLQEDEKVIECAKEALAMDSDELTPVDSISDIMSVHSGTGWQSRMPEVTRRCSYS